MKKEFKDPNITINKVYTKTGDDGKTAVIGGQRLSKDDIRIDAYGDVDELNSIIGGIRSALSLHNPNDNKLDYIDCRLLQIQHELFNLGTMLATVDKTILEELPSINSENIKSLENDIDDITKILPKLKSFTLPGGSDVNVWFHLARTVCRRSERKTVTLSKKEDINEVCIKYLNRLSDLLFVWSRYANKALKIDEVLWDPNKSS